MRDRVRSTVISIPSVGEVESSVVDPLLFRQFAFFLCFALKSANSHSHLFV